MQLPDEREGAVYDDEPAGIGHNLPDEFGALKARADEIVATANLWAKERPVFTDDEMAGKAHDFIKQARKAEIGCDDERKRLNVPHDDAIKTNNDRWRPLISALKIVQNLLKPRRTAYLDAKEKREKAAAEAKRREAEAAQRAAEEAQRKAEAPDDGNIVEAHVAAQEAKERANQLTKDADHAERAPTQIRGTVSGTASHLRRTYHGNIADDMKVFRRYRKNANVIEALQKAVNAEIRRADNEDIRTGAFRIPGVEIVETKTAA